MPRLAVLWLLCSANLAFSADLFQRPHDLVTLSTEHFTFVFAKDQQPVAEALVAMAEPLYTEVAEKLRVPKTLHLPVVITPDTDDLNGSFTNYPSMRIVCYQAPLSPNSGFATFNNVLRKLFLHELVHAVSLTQTDDFGRFLVALFGDAAFPALYNTTPSLSEGIAVAFESADGWGRANDAASAALIQQALLEHQFPSFLEASGAREGYPQGLYYAYGGWFSRYLLETGGDDRFAAFWKLLGSRINPMDSLFFKGSFQQVYGKPLNEAWQDFGNWMALKVPVRTDVRVVSDDVNTVLAVTGNSQSLYWADSRGLWTLEKEVPKFLVRLNGYTNRLALSPDGTKILISTARPNGPLAQVRLREYDLVQRRFTDREFPSGLIEAAYWGDGLVACRIAGYTVDLVTVINGETKVLVHGTETFIPSVPSSFNGGILFLLQNEGEKHLAVLEADGSVQVLEADLGGIRNLSTDGQRAWFAWDNDKTLLKLGVLEGDLVKVYPSLSGGVQFPQGLDDGIYYFGAFAKGQLLMRLPDIEPLSQPHRWIRHAKAEMTQPGSFDRAPALASKPYQPFEWLLTPPTRFPTLFLDPSAPLDRLVRGAGFGTESRDPADLLSLSTRASWLGFDRFADWSVSTTIHGPFDTTVDAFDSLFPSSDPSSTVDARALGGRVTLADTANFDLGSLSGLVSVSAFRAFWGTTYRSPYDWTTAQNALPVTFALGYRDVQKFDADGQRLGFTWEQAWDGAALLIPGQVPGVAQTSASLYLPFWRFHLGATSAVSTSERLTLTTGGPELSGAPWLGAQRFEFAPLFGPFNLSGRWFAAAQLDAGHSFPVNFELPLGVYLASFDVQVGYRALWLGAFLDEVYAIAAFDLRPGLIPALVTAHQGIGVRVEQGVSTGGGPLWSLWYEQSLY